MHGHYLLLGCKQFISPNLYATHPLIPAISNKYSQTLIPFIQVLNQQVNKNYYQYR